MRAIDASNYFMGKSLEGGPKALSHLALQILLYYAQGWSLCVEGRALFDDGIEAWTSGPVVPSVHEALKGEDQLALSAIEADDFEPEARAAQFLDLVWTAYGAVPPWTLRTMAQDEAAWKSARAGLSAADPGRPAISLDTLERSFTALRDRLLEEADLAPLESADDLEWLASAMRAHKGE